MTLMLADDHWSSNDKYGLNDLKAEKLYALLDRYVNSVSTVFHLGDQTDKRHFDAVLMDKMTRVYLQALGSRINKLVVIAGNHDASDRVITPFSTFVNGTNCNGKGAIVIGYHPQRIGDFVCKGWSSNDCCPEATGKYLLTHARVKEWAVTGEKAFTLGELNALGFDRVILGDTHSQLKSGKVLSVGCLFPSSFKDRDIEAGAVLFDEDRNTFERIKIPNYPVFRVIEATENTPEPSQSFVKGNIIRLEFRGPQKWITDALKKKWQTAIWAMQPRYVEFGKDYFVGETKIEQTNSALPVEERYCQFADEMKWGEKETEIGEKALQ